MNKNFAFAATGIVALGIALAGATAAHADPEGTYGDYSIQDECGTDNDRINTTGTYFGAHGAGNEWIVFYQAGAGDRVAEGQFSDEPCPVFDSVPLTQTDPGAQPGGPAYVPPATPATQAPAAEIPAAAAPVVNTNTSAGGSTTVSAPAAQAPAAAPATTAPSASAAPEETSTPTPTPSEETVLSAENTSATAQGAQITPTMMLIFGLLILAAAAASAAVTGYFRFRKPRKS